MSFESVDGMPWKGRKSNVVEGLTDSILIFTSILDSSKFERKEEKRKDTFSSLLTIFFISNLENLD